MTGDSNRSTGKTFGIVKATAVSTVMTFVKNFHRMQQILLNSRLLEKKVPKQSVNLSSIDSKNDSKISCFCRKQKCRMKAQAVVRGKSDDSRHDDSTPLILGDGGYRLIKWFATP